LNEKFIGTISNLLTKKAIKRIQFPIACAKNVSDEFFEKDKIRVEYVRNGVAPFAKDIRDRNEIKKHLA